MGADVGEAGVRRPEGRVARGPAALGEHDRGVGEQCQRDDDDGDGRGAHAQQPVRALVAAPLQVGGAGRDDREQREHRQPLRGGVRGVQRAHRGEGRSRGACQRPRAQRNRRRAQLRAGAVEGDERSEASQQTRDRAAREAQIGAHPQRGGGRRRGDPQRARAGGVAREARAEDEPDRRQRARRVPVGQGLLQAPAGALRRVQVHDAGQKSPGEPVGDDDKRGGRQGGLDQARRAPIAPHQRPGNERRQVEQRELELLIGARGARRPARRDPRPHGQPGQRDEGNPRRPRARQREARDRQGAQREQHPGADRRDDARSLEEGAAEEREHEREQQEADLDGRERCAAHGGAAYPRYRRAPMRPIAPRSPTTPALPTTAALPAIPALPTTPVLPATLGVVMRAG